MFQKTHLLFASVLTISIMLTIVLIYSSNRKPLLINEQATLRKILNCNDVTRSPRVEQRGKYWVLYNYFKAEVPFACHESITYTTHGDFTFLDNLEPLVEKWKGPISLALYSPGSDYDATIDAVRYLRDCGSVLIQRFVTFHIFFETDHMPKKVYTSSDMFTSEFDCNVIPPFNVTTYRKMNSLTYPVNVARNIARVMAQTHFVLASDIELYPSLNVIPSFLDMIRKSGGILTKNNRPKVFVLNLFEVTRYQQVPETKTELRALVEMNVAFPFHLEICTECHKVPKQRKWLRSSESENMEIFTIGKRLGQFARWEPIYIGTNEEPLYDERLTWEGKSDKMGQGYLMCLLDYDFFVLSNAFLVHKPGIKVQRNEPRRNVHIHRTDSLIKKHILPELNIIYKRSSECKL